MRLIKAGESDPVKLRVYFNIRLLDSLTPALGEDNGQPQLSVNGGFYDNNGISALSSFGYGHYSAQIDPSFVLMIGDVLQTRYKGLTTVETPGSSIQVVDQNEELPESVLAASFYGSVTEADMFFKTEIKSEAWDNATLEEKLKSLRVATRSIDRLSFSGLKTDNSQTLQFPRKNNIIDPKNQIMIIVSEDLFIPEDIKISTFLVAYSLLDGYDPDIEINNLAATSNRHIVSSQYDRSFVLEHIRAGIPSARAWGYLKPYLRDPNELVLSRI